MNIEILIPTICITFSFLVGFVMSFLLTRESLRRIIKNLKSDNQRLVHGYAALLRYTQTNIPVLYIVVKGENSEGYEIVQIFKDLNLAVSLHNSLVNDCRVDSDYFAILTTDNLGFIVNDEEND